MITYNHESYIEKAILSVLEQKVNFPLELIVADDCSPDKTEEIVKNLIAKNPKGNLIKYTRHMHNLGPAANSLWSLKQAKGKYIALCEGDDYWLDPLKLKLQVEFLETNIDFSMCFHRVKILNETSGSVYSYPLPKINILNFKNILFRHYIPTCSLVFKKELLPNPLPEWLKNSKMCDIPLELFLADKGKAFYFDQEMAVYRLNNGGITQNKEHIKNGRKSYDYIYLNLRKYFGRKYFILFTLIILKNKLGYIKDFLGFNRN